MNSCSSPPPQGEEPPLNNQAELNAELARLAHENSELKARLLRRTQYDNAAEIRRKITQELQTEKTLFQLFEQILRHFCQRLNWVIGEAWTLENSSANIIAAWKSPLHTTLGTNFNARYAEPEFLLAHLKFNEPKWIPDIWLERTIATPKRLADEGLHSALVLPLLDGNRTVGMLVFYNHKIAAPDPALLRILHLLMGEIGQLHTRKRIEDKLKLTQSSYYHLIRSVSEYALFRVDNAGLIETWEENCSRLFSKQSSDVLGAPITTLSDIPEVRTRLLGGLSQAMVAAWTESLSFFIDYNTVLIEFTINAIRIGQIVEGFAVVAKDITKQEMQQRALKQLNTELSQMAFGVIQQQEMERKYLAEELHDNVVQTLALLNLKIGMATQELAQNDVASPSHLLLQCQDMTKQVITAIRGLLGGLHPVLLDELGLAESLRRLIKTLSPRISCYIDSHIQTLAVPLTADANTMFYRIAQEAITNAAKHAQASELKLRLYQDEKETVLIVKDNGKGWNELERRTDSLGVTLMRERANLVNARLNIVSEPSIGTELRVTLTHTKG